MKRSTITVVLGIVTTLMLAAAIVHAARAADLPIPPRTLAIGVTPLQGTRSILPPGARSIDITLTRDKPRLEESQRAFVRRVLSPRGPKERLE